MSTHFEPRRIPVTKKRPPARSFASFGKAGFSRVVLWCALFFSTLLVGGSLVFYFVFLSDLPSIRTLEGNILPQSSIIYDRNGNELYSLYATEKRRYVGYSAINQNMVHAIVSAEDKTFFDNQGFDVRGLVRSGLDYVTGRTERVSGTSTISQQLIRNVFLSNERSLTRKIKEIYLSFLMNHTYSKEKILEIYLNKISYGSNAYGIEEASRTFFDKSAKDLDVLQSSILASIPKGPTYYSPYTQRLRLMGGVRVSTGKEDQPVYLDSAENLAKFKPFMDAFLSFVTNLTFVPAGPGSSALKVCNVDAEYFDADPGIKDGCVAMEYADLLGFFSSVRVRYTTLHSAKASEDLASYTLAYQTGRKDFVLGRMFQDGHIDPKAYKDAFIRAFSLQFAKYQEDIKYPHFVFYVQEYLEKTYGRDFLDQGGLKIYTTIDPTLQDAAESILNKQAGINATKYKAADAGLVTLDNRTGQILAMIGGANYFSQKEGANVNIITAKRQPGSSFKPLVYALAVSKNPIGPDTPIYDVPTKFGNWEPKNFDGSFLGRMAIRKALGYSRNIPAIKMFELAGGEDSIVDFVNSLGINSLQKNAGYGAPMAIGTAELEPLELATAYSVFANGGYRRDPTPILKIVDSKGNIIDQFVQKKGILVLQDSVAYIMSDILSNPSNRPTDYWNNMLTVNGYSLAAKTGTSNKDVSVGGVKKILPRDLWTAGYSRYFTTVVWTGNIDGSPTNMSADGLSCAAPIWRDVMARAHKGLKNLPFEKPDSVYTATISNLTGKLASQNTPDAFKVRSIFAVEPKEFEGLGREVDVDLLCNGRVTDSTPKDAIKHGYLMDYSPVIEGVNPAWARATESYIRWSLGNALGGDAAASSVVFQYDGNKVCDRPNSSGDVNVSTNLSDGATRPVGSNYLRIDYSASNPVVRLEVYVDDALVKTVPVENQRSGSYVSEDFSFGAGLAGTHSVRVRAIDSYYYAGQTTASVTFADDRSAPVITTTNPSSGDRAISVYADQFFNLRFKVDDASPITAVNLYLDGALFRILGGGRDFNLPINDTHDFSVGSHKIGIEALDASRNRGYEEFDLTVLAR